MPQEIRVAVGAVTLAVRRWVAAEPVHPPVVLLPATGETAEDWDFVASALSATRTVHAVSLRGHGASDWPGDYSIQLLADDVTDLLPHLGAGPVDLVGHSLGGLVAAKVASACPQRVRRLVLEDVGLPHPRPASPPARPEGDLLFDWRVIEQVRPEIDDPDPQWDRIVAGIHAPTLVVGGGPRSPVSPQHIAELVGIVPDGDVVTLDAGHLVHATKPEQFTHELLAFLDQP